MIDLHTHILPGVDDGVRTDEEAIEFARMAAEDGVEVIVATPHCRDGFYVNERASVLAGVERLRGVLERAGVSIDLRPGAEVHLCPELVERVRDGRALTLNDNGKTLLLEFSLSQYPVKLENLVFELKLAGIEVLVAHPERIAYFQEDARRYEDLVRLGAYGQITSGSVVGDFGSSAAEYSAELARKGLVHVLASDAHNVRGRSPLLTPALKAMIPMVGEARARAMVDAIPRALLAGTSPEVPPVEGSASRKTSFFSRIFSKS